MEEHSPAVCFDSRSCGSGGAAAPHPLPKGCCICLSDFHVASEVRRVRGYRHVFHRVCLDRWVTHGHRTSSLCRASPSIRSSGPAPPTSPCQPYCLGSYVANPLPPASGRRRASPPSNAASRRGPSLVARHPSGSHLRLCVLNKLLVPQLPPPLFSLGPHLGSTSMAVPSLPPQVAPAAPELLTSLSRYSITVRRRSQQFLW
uniref:RING-type domain-containing protein n=1 Tax=Zea mays TaxID=4577 RepID=A0A804MK34_MAIZE